MAAGDHQHGTPQRYRDGCHCQSCRDGWSRYRHRTELRTARGETWADHDRYRDLLAPFADAGVHPYAIAEATGAHRESVAAILHPDADRTVRADTAARLDGLSWDDLPDSTRVDAHLLRHQVDRLLRRGVTSAGLAARLGYTTMPCSVDRYPTQAQVRLGMVRRLRLANDMWPHVPTDTCEDCDAPTPLWLRWCGPCGDRRTLPTTPAGWATRRATQRRAAYRHAQRQRRQDAA